MKKMLTFMLAINLMAFVSFGAEAVTSLASQAGGNEIGAKSAVVIEAMTGRVLFAQHENERLPIASTTKILTALIALEQPDIDAVFTIDETAIMVEGSSMGLQKGDKASLRALAAGMLLPSGNDGANAAAVRIAGSIPAFADIMNARVKELGLSNSSFKTPSGLDADNHYSSAYDMAMIAREALKNDEFRAICSQYRMRTSYGNPPYGRWLTNHNKLLNYVDGAVGVKTGFTKKAGRCLVSAAKRDGVELIVVTLDCPDDWSVHESLYERFFSRIHVEDLTKQMPEINVPVTGGVKGSVRALKTDTAQVPIPSDGADVEYGITLEQFVYAPVLAGQYLGDVKIYVDGEQVYRLSLTAAEDVPLLHEYKENKSFMDILSGIFDKLRQI